MERMNEAIMVDAILSAFRLLEHWELEYADDELAELLWRELCQLGEFDLYVYVRIYRRALYYFRDEVAWHGDEGLARLNALSRALSPYEWALYGRRARARA